MPNPIPFISAARPVFPEYSPAHDKHDGLVCVSDALTPEMLLAAYRKGVFPWFSEHGLFYWFAQHPRAVLLPERLHIGRSLAKTLRRKSYRVSVNACFAEVIAACAQIPRAEQGGTWITPDFQAAYTALHCLGHAHSFECWLPDAAGRWHLAGCTACKSAACFTANPCLPAAPMRPKSPLPAPCRFWRAAASA